MDLPHLATLLHELQSLLRAAKGEAKLLNRDTDGVWGALDASQWAFAPL